MCNLNRWIFQTYKVKCHGHSFLSVSVILEPYASTVYVQPCIWMKLRTHKTLFSTKKNHFRILTWKPFFAFLNHMYVSLLRCSAKQIYSAPFIAKLMTPLFWNLCLLVLLKFLSSHNIDKVLSIGYSQSVTYWTVN